MTTFKKKGADAAREEKAEAKTKEKDIKDLDELLASLQEKFGEGAIMKLGEIHRVDVDVVPTGSFSLDLA